MQPSLSVKTKVDKTKELAKAMKVLTRDIVLVGIPEDANARPDGDIGNAELGYIHEFGSPANNIPARPFLIPGVESAMPQVTKIMHDGARKVLSGNSKAARPTLVMAGSEASVAVKTYITAGLSPPLKDATVEARLRRTPSRKAEAEYLRRRALGESPEALHSLGLIKPLIDTGVLLRSVTYVIREDK